MFIGIDPGKHGAMCFLGPNDPLFITMNPDYAANRILQRLAVTALGPDPVYIALESVHSLYRMTAKSNFTFGGMFWRARTILNCASMPYELVTPKAWQQAVGVPAKKDRPVDTPLKAIVAEIAHDLYPTADIFGPRGGQLEGRSDALMIAHYLKLKHGE